MDIRLKAVSLVGDLFALQGSTISEAFKPVFLEFLKRLSDRDVKVRMSVLEYAKICLLENPFRSEANEIICKDSSTDDPKLITWSLFLLCE